MEYQGGFTLTEIAIAAVVLGVALCASSLAFSSLRQFGSSSEQQELAWQAILSEENALRAARYESLRSGTLPMSLSGLPGGQGLVTLRSISDLDAVEARFEVTWFGARGKHRLFHAAVFSPFGGMGHARRD